MNSLDKTLDLFASEEPSAEAVQQAQRKLETVIADASPARPRKTRVGGWLAAAASAVVAVMALVLLPLGPMPALAFSEVQQHFREFRQLRFEVEQRANGQFLMKSRVSVLANGSVRAEVGNDIVVVVNTEEKRVLTLMKPAKMAVVNPLVEAGTKDDALKWLQDVRDFQGVARELPETRFIKGQRAKGWELPLAQGTITLWANAAGLPLEMKLDQGVAIDLSFRFEFEPDLPAETFSTKVPAGYTLGAEED
jgi:outer membrane lipoprotein-sorting protein